MWNRFHYIPNESKFFTLVIITKEEDPPSLLHVPCDDTVDGAGRESSGILAMSYGQEDDISHYIVTEQVCTY